MCNFFFFLLFIKKCKSVNGSVTSLSYLVFSPCFSLNEEAHSSWSTDVSASISFLVNLCTIFWMFYQIAYSKHWMNSPQFYCRFKLLLLLFNILQRKRSVSIQGCVWASCVVVADLHSLVLLLVSFLPAEGFFLLLEWDHQVSLGSAVSSLPHYVRFLGLCCGCSTLQSAINDPALNVTTKFCSVHNTSLWLLYQESAFSALRISAIISYNTVARNLNFKSLN